MSFATKKRRYYFFTNSSKEHFVACPCLQSRKILVHAHPQHSVASCVRHRHIFVCNLFASCFAIRGVVGRHTTPCVWGLPHCCLLHSGKKNGKMHDRKEEGQKKAERQSLTQNPVFTHGTVQLRPHPCTVSRFHVHITRIVFGNLDSG